MEDLPRDAIFQQPIFSIIFVFFQLELDEAIECVFSYDALVIDLKKIYNSVFGVEKIVAKSTRVAEPSDVDGHDTMLINYF